MFYCNPYTVHAKWLTLNVCVIWRIPFLSYKVMRKSSFGSLTTYDSSEPFRLLSSLGVRYLLSSSLFICSCPGNRYSKLDRNHLFMIFRKVSLCPNQITIMTDTDNSVFSLKKMKKQIVQEARNSRCLFKYRVFSRKNCYTG